MRQPLRRRFWADVILASVSTALLVLTVVWDEWIEIMFHVDPDAGSGTLEWAIVGVTLLLTLAFSMLARLEWRKAAVQIA